MTYGYPIGASLPEVTDRGPRFAQMLVDAGRILVREVERKVPQASLYFDATLPIYGSQLDQVKALHFKNQAAPLDTGAFPRALYFSGNEFYANAGSAQIRITKDGALDFSSSGAITGSGYGKNGTQIRWVGASSYYELYARTGLFADAEADDAVLVDDFSGNRVSFRAAAMAADVEWTLPTEAPALLSGLFVDQAGAMSWSATPKHGEMSLFFAPVQGYGGTEPSFSSDPNEEYLVPVAGGGLISQWAIPLLLNTGDRIKSLTAYCRKTATATLIFSLRKIGNGETSTQVSIGTWSTNASGAQAPSRTLESPVTVSFSEAYMVHVSGGDSGDRVIGVKVVYDRP